MFKQSPTTAEQRSTSGLLASAERRGLFQPAIRSGKTLAAGTFFTHRVCGRQLLGSLLACLLAVFVSMWSGERPLAMEGVETNIPVASVPLLVSVNSVGNKIYGVNSGRDRSTVMNGADISITPVAVGRAPYPERRDSDAPKAIDETKAAITQMYASLPLRFEPNVGQVDSQVRFIGRGAGYGFFLTANQAVLSFSEGTRAREELTSDSTLAPKEDRKTAVVRMQFKGANPAAQIRPEEELPTKTSYFIGNDPAKWRSNVSNYARVRYASIYPGIDVVYYGKEGKLEYDLEVSPGANPEIIRLAFSGANHIRLDGKGNLTLSTSAGRLQQQKPFIYQEVNGTKQRIAGRYAIRGSEVGFSIGKYDQTKPLIIDPVLVFSSYLGGSGDEQALAIATNGGYVYVAGRTSSTTFPSSAANTFQGQTDAFVAQIGYSGTSVQTAIYFGGSGFDQAKGLAILNGDIFITGETNSTNLPVMNAQQAFLAGSSDVFVARMSCVSSVCLAYSTYLGGSSFDIGYAIAVDTSGNAYVTGGAGSTDFPTTNPQQPANNGSRDAFVTKLDGAGQRVYSTYLGGSDFDNGNSIAIDSSGSAYVAGWTFSSNFPTANPKQPSLGGASDAFAAKLNPAGSALIYSTFVGGTGSESGTGMAVDASGNAHITGNTSSSNFPTSSAMQPSLSGSSDAFVTKLNPTGTAFVYSTYLGGTGDESGNGISIDSSGNAYVVGQTSSGNFPTAASPHQSSSGGGNDAFLSQINSAGLNLLYSTYFGGSAEDYGNAIALQSGDVLIAGTTFSSNFPNARAFQPSRSGSTDGFVARFSPPVTLTINSTDPNSGVNITISPNDINGQGNGLTSITREYAPETLVTLTAPSSAGGNHFVKWQNNGVDVPFSTLQTSVFVGTAQTLTAVYVPPPPNDAFLNAQSLGSDVSGVVSGSNFGATKEPPNEGNHSGNGGGASVWYKWIAPSTGSFTFTTHGVDSNTVNTVMAVYTGSNLASLVEVEDGLEGRGHNNDDPEATCNFGYSRLAFTATAGATYYIAIDGVSGANGSFGLRWGKSAQISTQPPGGGTLHLTGAACRRTGSTFTDVPTGASYSVFYIGQFANYLTYGGSGSLSPLTGDVSGIKFAQITPAFAVSGFVNPFGASITCTNTNTDPGYPDVPRTTSGSGAQGSWSLGGLWQGSNYRCVAAQQGYTFTPNPYNASVNAAGIQFSGTLSPIPVTVETNPAGRAFTVDGATYTSSQTFQWQPGSSHDLSTTSPQAGAAGTQYVWSGWSDSGAAISRNVTAPNVPTTYTANFSTQHLLTMIAGAGGTVSPASGYFSEGQSVQISATPNSGFIFSGWTGVGSGSVSGSTNPAQVTMNGPITQTANFTGSSVQVTVQTNPAGRTVSIDGGAPMTAPVDVQWTPGTNHTIATTSPQPGAAGTQYVWTSWNDDGTMSHSVTAPSIATTYTANFSTQYLLTMNTSTGGTVSPLSGYFNSGQSVQISATPNSGFIFSGWTGTGMGSFSGSTNPVNVIMNGPITQTASFAANSIQATVQTNPTGLIVSIDGGPPLTAPQVVQWTPGTSHTIATISPQAVDAGTQYSWTSWSGDGAIGPISHSVTAPNSDTTYTANFLTQYRLTMNAGNGGTVSPASGFFNSGPSVQISATPNSGFTFTGWTGTGTGSYSGNNNPALVTINGPITQTASFSQNPVKVTVQTNPAGRTVSIDGGAPVIAPVDVQWTPGTNHTIATTSPQAGAAGTQYVWSGWSDSGAAISRNVTAPNVPTTYTANFSTQHLLTMIAGAGGTVSPASGYFSEGQSVQISATPSAGSSFSGWTGMGSGSVSGSTNPAQVTMNGPITQTANFTGSSVQVTVQTNPGGRTVSIDGGAPMTAPVDVQWIPGSSHTIATTSPQAGAAGTQYVWTSWNDGGTMSHSVPAPSIATTYTANFNTQYLLTMNTGTGGTVSPANGYFNSGLIVQITATPNSGFIFSDWTGTGGGSVTGNVNPAQVTMNGPIAETARFLNLSTSLILLVDPSGPAADQIAAVESLSFLRDPFPVVVPESSLNKGTDRNTRVIIFVMNLQLAQGETASSVVVNLIGSNNQSYDIPAEAVLAVPTFSFTQVIFRLPNGLAPGTCTVKIRAHGDVSNAGTMRISN